MEPIFEMKNVSAYGENGRALLCGAELTVRPGERVRAATERPRFTALARLIGGLAAPAAGEVRLLGRSIEEWPPSARAGKVGFVPREADLWGELTVLENTALPLRAAGVPAADRREAAMAALENLGLGYAAYVYPRALGKCEARLAALARALVRSPALLLLDDPGYLLDPKETERLAAALFARWEAERFAVLYRGGEILPADRTVSF